MRNELRIILSYVVAVFRQWWVVVVEGLLVLTDIFERIFGTWLLPSTRIKFGIGFTALVAAQYRAYRQAMIENVELQNEKAAIDSEKAALEQQQQSRSIQEWRPKAWIESEPLQNYLVLKSDQEFLLDSVSIKFPNGAVACRIENRERVSSTGFKFQIPGDKLTRDLWNLGTRTGSLEAVVVRNDHMVTVDVPFVAIQSMDRNTFWIRLQG
jgi:hypothetical protein